MSRKNVMLMGFSGSGKTTLSKHISGKFHLQQVLSSDEIHTKLRKILPNIFKEWETNIDSFSYKITQITTKVIQMCDILLKSHSKNGVVYDACNLQESTRCKMAKILGNPILVDVQVNENDLYDRLQNRENPEVWMELWRKQRKDYEKSDNVDIIYNSSTDSDFQEFDKNFIVEYKK